MGNQGAGRFRKNNTGAKRLHKIEKEAGRLKVIWEQGAVESMSCGSREDVLAVVGVYGNFLQHLFKATNVIHWSKSG